MNIKHLLFFGLVMNLTACRWGDGDTSHPKPDITTDTLTYTYKIIKERAADCGSKPDSGCTVAMIKYPVFNGQSSLNQTVIKNTIMLFDGNNPDVKPDTSLNQQALNFIKSYEADNTKSDRPNIFYTLDLKTKILRQDSSLVTLQLDGYSYTGGAHSSSITGFINWDTKSQKSISLNDILTGGAMGKLTTVADTIFRAQEKLSPSASLAKDYFFKDNKFALNENFIITPLGLRFLYNQYKIKPYAAGKTELFIPYAKIRSLLKPNTVITQYIK